MKRWLHKEEKLAKEPDLCMSAARGNKMVNPGKMPFSFYFSEKNSSHSIRVKPVLNPDRITSSKTGTLKLCDDWAYTPSKEDKHVKEAVIADMKTFFRNYFVLFSLVWDGHLSDPVLADYFEGRATFEELIQDIDFYSEYQEELDKVTDIAGLEAYLKTNNLVNMYGNK